MARPARFLLRLLLTAVIAGGAVLAVVSRADRRGALELLPSGASAALEAVDIAGTLRNLEGTRFAAAFSQSATRAWLEQTDTARALDALRAGIGGATGFTPARRHVLDLTGLETAIAWYPPRAAAQTAGPPWVAAGRLSWRAWGIAGSLRAAARLGLGKEAVVREEVAGTTVFSLGSGPGATHLYFLGRLLVLGNDRDLVRRSARIVAGSEPALQADEAWKRVFSKLPAPAGLRLYAGAEAFRTAGVPAAAGGARAIGAVVATGGPVVADVFVDAPGRGPEAGGTSGPPPVLGLSGGVPLFFFSTAGPVPPLVADWLTSRAHAVARRERSGATPVLPPLGSGYAIAVTSAGGQGLFPRPEGVVAIGLRNDAAARDALRLLFPSGARAAEGRWGPALSTRESFPLAGEFELWGAAVGPRLVFATSSSQLAALGSLEREGGAEESFAPGAGWPVDTVSTVDVSQALPVLRRYAAPLSGLLHARNPSFPEIAGDLDLLAALRAVSVTSSTGAEGTLARVTFQTGDLPAGARSGRLPGAQ